MRAILSVEALCRSLHEGSCARHNTSHVPGHLCCEGVAGLTATMVYNWRVLWWSLPKVQRKEHMLRMFAKSLRDHKANRVAEERWRMRFSL